jgi:hypothetical protein
VMCAEQGACVRRRSWAGYTSNMFEFEFPTGTGDRASRALETSVLGVFAIGDVRSDSIKRVAAAVGEAAQVVATLHTFLANAERPLDRTLPADGVSDSNDSIIQPSTDYNSRERFPSMERGCLSADLSPLIRRESGTHVDVKDKIQRDVMTT